MGYEVVVGYWVKWLRPLAAALFSAVIVLVAPPPGVAAPEQSGGVPILVYHRFGPVVADSMTVRTTVFEAQLAWLRAKDYHIVPLRAVVESLSDPAAPMPPRAVAITVDDGHKSVYTELFPLIQRYRFPVTLFIYPSAISNASYALTWDQLADMKRTGLVDIQSHTYWHPNFNHERARLSPDAYRAFVMTQFTRPQQILNQRLGSSVDMLAWPFGIHDSQLEQWAALAGYRAAFTLDRRGAGHEANMLALPRYLMTDGDRGSRFAAMIESASGGRSKP